MLSCGLGAISNLHATVHIVLYLEIRLDWPKPSFILRSETTCCVHHAVVVAGPAALVLRSVDYRVRSLRERSRGSSILPTAPRSLQSQSICVICEALPARPRSSPLPRQWPSAGSALHFPTQHLDILTTDHLASHDVIPSPRI